MGVSVCLCLGLFPCVYWWRLMCGSCHSSPRSVKAWNLLLWNWCVHRLWLKDFGVCVVCFIFLPDWATTRTCQMTSKDCLPLFPLTGRQTFLWSDIMIWVLLYKQIKILIKSFDMLVLRQTDKISLRCWLQNRLVHFIPLILYYILRMTLSNWLTLTNRSNENYLFFSPTGIIIMFLSTLILWHLSTFL